MFMIGILRKTLLILSLFSVIGCNAPSFYDWISKPMLLDLNPPPGPPEYRAAYYDACMTAAQENNQNVFALHGRAMIKNPEFSNKSPIYRSVWRSAYIYCGLWIPYQSRNRASFIKPDFTLQLKSIFGSKKHNLLQEAPPGPYPFRVGWEEGCDTGKAATGSSHQKMPYRFIKSAKWIEGDRFNPEYEKGWETAFWWCQRYYDIMESPDRKGFL